MKEYIKPEVELINFATESIAAQGNTGYDGGGASPLGLDDLA